MMAYLRTLLVGRFTTALLTSFAAMALFVFVAYEVGEGGTRRLDARMLALSAAHRTPALQQVMQGVSLLASGAAQALIALACAVAAWRRPRFRPNALSMLAAIGGGEILVYGLKALFHRARPSPTFAHLGYSFPSGHSFFAVTLYGMAAYWLTHPNTSTGNKPRRPWVWVPMASLILLIGVSRVILGVHYPSDVLAGFLTALPWLWACLALPRIIGLLENRRQPFE